MKTLLITLFISSISTMLWANGSVPSLPCYVEGKMVSASMPINKCMKLGGSYKVKDSYKEQ